MIMFWYLIPDIVQTASFYFKLHNRGETNLNFEMFLPSNDLQNVGIGHHYSENMFGALRY